MPVTRPTSAAASMTAAAGAASATATAAASTGAAKASRRLAAADPSPRRRRFELDLQETAARLFAQRGFAGTTLRDIADELGMSRSSLYNYVTSKEELLGRLSAQFLEDEVHHVQGILARTDLTPVEKLEQMVKQIVVGLAERPSLTALFEYHRETLPDDYRRPVDELRRNITAQLISVIRDGVRDGSFYVDDERIASYVIGNIAVGSTRWMRPGEGVEAIATNVARMAVRSLQKAEPSTDTPRTVRDSVDRLRDELESLDRLVASQLDPPPAAPHDDAGHGRRASRRRR